MDSGEVTGWACLRGYMAKPLEVRCSSALELMLRMLLHQCFILCLLLKEGCFSALYARADSEPLELQCSSGVKGVIYRSHSMVSVIYPCTFSPQQVEVSWTGCEYARCCALGMWSPARQPGFWPSAAADGVCVGVDGTGGGVCGRRAGGAGAGVRGDAASHNPPPV